MHFSRGNFGIDHYFIVQYTWHRHPFITALQRSCRKVMFLVMSVCPQGGDSHVTITHDTLDPTVQGSPPPGHGNPLSSPPPPRTWDLTTGELPRHRISQYNPRADIWWLRSGACGTHPTGKLFCFFTDTGQSIIVQPLQTRFTNISDENLIQNCSFSLKYTRCQYLLR